MGEHTQGGTIKSPRRWTWEAMCWFYRKRAFLVWVKSSEHSSHIIKAAQTRVFHTHRPTKLFLQTFVFSALGSYKALVLVSHLALLWKHQACRNTKGGRFILICGFWTSIPRLAGAIASGLRYGRISWRTGYGKAQQPRSKEIAGEKGAGEETDPSRACTQWVISSEMVLPPAVYHLLILLSNYPWAHQKPTNEGRTLWSRNFLKPLSKKSFHTVSWWKHVFLLKLFSSGFFFILTKR